MLPTSRRMLPASALPSPSRTCDISLLFSVAAVGGPGQTYGDLVCKYTVVCAVCKAGVANGGRAGQHVKSTDRLHIC